MRRQERGKGPLLLASLLEQAGRAREAISVLEQAAARNPKDPGVGHRLALLYSREGRFSEAAQACERLLDLNPRDIVALDLLAAAYVRLGDQDRLWPVVRRLLMLCPEEPRYRMLKAALLQQAGQTPAAMEEYLSVLERDEDEASTEAAEEAVYLLDMIQIQQLLAAARADRRLRARIQNDLQGVLREWRLRLSEDAEVWLEGLDLDAFFDEQLPGGHSEPIH